MAVQTSTGITLSVVQDEPATIDAAGFENLTFVEVGEVTEVPEFGPNTEVVTHQPLATGVTEKYPGFTDNGSLAISMGQDAEDAGQTIMLESQELANKGAVYSFSIEFNDGTIDYFTGGIFSYTTNPGGANSMVASSGQIEINSAIIRVIPS